MDVKKCTFFLKHSLEILLLEKESLGVKATLEFGTDQPGLKEQIESKQTDCILSEFLG